MKKWKKALSLLLCLLLTGQLAASAPGMGCDLTGDCKVTLRDVAALFNRCMS